MSPRDIARAAVVAGWLTGMALIAAGWPLPAALAVLAAAITAAVALRRWGGKLSRTLRLLLRDVVKMRAVAWLHRKKTGGTLERA